MIIRDGQAGDAADLARMISDFNVEEGSPGRMTEKDVVDLCFSAQRLYQPLVAEEGSGLIGYALITRIFDTDPCAWCAFMQDLFVRAEWRSRCVGRRLIAAAARYTVDENLFELVWHVRDQNSRGRAFYAQIGGQEQTPILVTLSGDALKQAATHQDYPLNKKTPPNQAAYP